VADRRKGNGKKAADDQLHREPRVYGQGGGYGQTGPGLNYEGRGGPDGIPPPPRVPPSPEGGGFHMGAYEAEHYRQITQREPGYAPYRGQAGPEVPNDRPIRTGHYGRGPRNYRRTDARIAEDVNDRLTDDWQIDATDIEVTVDGGEVTLRGSVDSRADKRRAEDIADAVSGVRDVHNLLRIQRSDVNQTPPSPLETRGT